MVIVAVLLTKFSLINVQWSLGSLLHKVTLVGVIDTFSN